jgi:DNA-binding NarL/FixJ family response regulator
MWIESRPPDNFRHPEKFPQPQKRERSFTGPGLEYDNPWKLTPAEKRVIHAVIETGWNKTAASKLGVTLSTVENHMASVSRKMGLARLTAVVTYDRWEREQ